MALESLLNNKGRSSALVDYKTTKPFVFFKDLMNDLI